MPADGCVTVSLRTSMTAEEIHRAHVARMQLWPRVASGANRKRIEVRNLACIFAKPCKNWDQKPKASAAEQLSCKTPLHFAQLCYSGGKLQFVAVKASLRATVPPQELG